MVNITLSPLCSFLYHLLKLVKVADPSDIVYQEKQEYT
jgi:hypothetical protein